VETIKKSLFPLFFVRKGREGGGEERGRRIFISIISRGEEGGGRAARKGIEGRPPFLSPNLEEKKKGSRGEKGEPPPPHKGKKNPRGEGGGGNSRP